jgi:hypothetical protein
VSVASTSKVTAAEEVEVNVESSLQLNLEPPKTPPRRGGRTAAKKGGGSPKKRGNSKK